MLGISFSYYDLEANGYTLHLEQVETLLKTQDPPAATLEAAPTSFASAQSNVSGIGLRPIVAPEFGVQNSTIGIVGVNDERWRYNEDSPQQPIDDLGFTADINMGMGLDDSTFTWEMIGLGLEEPLPPQESIDDLYVIVYAIPFRIMHLHHHRHQIYFDKIHHSLPMIHKYRYLAAMNL